MFKTNQSSITISPVSQKLAANGKLQLQVCVIVLHVKILFSFTLHRTGRKTEKESWFDAIVVTFREVRRRSLLTTTLFIHNENNHKKFCKIKPLRTRLFSSEDIFNTLIKFCTFYGHSSQYFYIVYLHFTHVYCYFVALFSACSLCFLIHIFAFALTMAMNNWAILIDAVENLTNVIKHQV